MTDQPRIIFTRYPAFRLLCGMALGILFYSTATWNIPGFLILFSCLSLLSAGFYYRKKLVLSFWVASFALGIWVGNSAQQVQIPQSIVSEIPTTISGNIVSVLRQDSLNFRCIVEGTIDAQLLPSINSSRVILSVNSLTNRENFLKVGSKIYAAGTLRTPQTPTLPMEFDERQYCKSQDVQFLMKAKASDVAIVEKAGGFPALVAEIVAALEQRIQILYSNESGAIVSALLLGNQTKISKETRKLYSLSGTAHILSVSGSHVGIIAAIIFVFLGFVRSRWLKFLIFTLAISAFIILSGMQPAAMRAGLMAILAMLGYTLQRRVFALNILCLSIVILLLCQPILIYSSGFQMSVASVFGITVFYAPFRATILSHLTNISSVTEFIASSLALTFAATVTVSPLVAYYFSTFSVVSPCTNVLIVPLMSLAMIFGMASVLILPINVGIATTYSAATAWCISTSESINQWSVNLPWAWVQSPELAMILSIGVSAAIIRVMMSSTRRQAIFRFVLSCTSIFLITQLIDFRSDTSSVIPRTFTNFTAIPISKDSTLVLMTDRKPHQFPYGDKAMEEFITSLPDSVILGIRGNSSEWISVRARESRPSIRVFTYPKHLEREVLDAQREEKMLHEFDR